MADEPLTARTYPIWFVTDEAGNKPKSGSLFEATCESMRLGNFNVNWVTQQECLKVQEKEPEIFVMDSFSGQAFEHLVSVKSRILGTLCCYGCLRDDKPFPRQSHPVYSISMMNVVVCCTNMGPSERAEIHKKVEYMGGSYSDNLTREVTHLIAGEVGSKKYHVAASFGLPILQPEWVEEVWHNTQYKLIHGRSLPYNYFRCPIFKGLGFSVSQLSVEERDFVKQVAEEEGATYSSSLDIDDTTHLILVEPTGEKYKYAKKWQCFCVHEDWFYDSLEAGYCMDENLYPPKFTETSPTPEPKPVESSSTSDESMEVDAPSSTTSQSPVNKEIPSVEILDSFSLSSLPKSDDFLDACNIFLSDFKDSHMKKLCKIINAGGGSRFSKYSECITHVVCGKKNSKLVDLIKADANRPHIVSFDWLLECYKEGRLIDETSFACMEKVPDNEMAPCEAGNVKCVPSNCAESQKSEEPLFDVDVVKQYMPS